MYFDDLKINYQKSKIVQSNNYYAFGLQTKDSWTRIDTKPNQYLYNAGSELNVATSNYDMMFRSYDPAIGRMSGVDPMVNSFASLTPYNYSFNDPVYWNDPSGAIADNSSPNSNSRKEGYEDCSCGMYGDNWNLETYGGGFVKYGPGDGGALASMGDAAGARLQIKQWVNDGLIASYGGGLQGLTSAMVALDAVQNGTYGANTFSYSVGNKTYGGTYHTTGGAVTSAAVSQVMASSNGGLVSMGDLDIFEFDGQQSNDGGLNWAAGGRAFVRTFLPFGNDIYPESEEPDYDPNRRVISATLPDLPIGPGGAVKILKYAKNAKKVVVIGEKMTERVIPYAKKIGATWFKARGKNPLNYMRNQVQWIRRQIKDPFTTIIDIGPKGSKISSPWYQKEIDMISKWLGNNL